MPNNNDELNTNNLIKSNNFNTFNYMSVNINMNPYTTISKCNIKKIDLNSSNKTRNSKIAKKKSTNDNYTSLRTTNNNYGIKKMNTSTCSLTTINKNKNNKKSRLTPDIETKEIKNGKRNYLSQNLKECFDALYQNKFGDTNFIHEYLNWLNK